MKAKKPRWFGNRYVLQYAEEIWGTIEYRIAKHGGWDWIIERSGSPDDETLAHGRAKTLKAAQLACGAAWTKLAGK